MAKEKKWTREEILKIVAESLKETCGVLDEAHATDEGDPLFKSLDKMKDQLILIAMAEAIKIRLK